MVIAEKMLASFEAASVRIRAHKVEPPVPFTMESGGIELFVSAELTTVFLGLGSNIGDRFDQLNLAIRGLGEAGITVEAVSSAYETAPVGEILDQPDFLNAAVRVETELEPEALLDQLKVIEANGQGIRATPAFPTRDRHRPAASRRRRIRDGSVEVATPGGVKQAVRARAAART